MSEVPLYRGGLVWPLMTRAVKRFRGGLVLKAHRLLYHSTLDLRVIKKKKTRAETPATTSDGERALLGFLAHKKHPPRRTLQ